MSRHRLLKVAIFIPGLVAIASGAFALMTLASRPTDRPGAIFIMSIGVYLIIVAIRKLRSGKVFNHK